MYLIKLSGACVACIMLISQTLVAQMPPTSSIAPTELDIDGDGIYELFVSEPMWNNGTGRVSLTLSSLPATPIIFQGVSEGDYFGWSICLISDENHTSGIRLVIGVPGANNSGVVLLFDLMQIQWGFNTTAEFIPRQTLRPYIETDSWFGFDLAPCFDVDNSGVVDIRIASKFDQANVSVTRTYIYDAVLGVSVACITPDSTSQESVPRPRSDVTLNGLVDEDDLYLILDQLGAETSTILSGDVTNDGITDGNDLVQLLSDYGDTFLQPDQSSNDDCLDFLGCGTERIRLPSGSACLTWLGCESVIANLVFDPNCAPGENASGCLLDWLEPINDPQSECLEQLQECLDNLCVQYAMNQISESCFGNPDNPDWDNLGEGTFGSIYCNPSCGCIQDEYGEFAHQPGGVTNIICDNGENWIYLQICSGCAEPGNNDLCNLLAHELLHVAQYCQRGWLTLSCQEQIARRKEYFRDPMNYLCNELDVLSQLNLIEGCSNPDRTDCESACISAMNTYGWYWGSVDACVLYCDQFGEFCLGFYWPSWLDQQ